MHKKNKKLTRSRLYNTLSLYLENNRVCISIFTRYLLDIYYVCKIIQRIINIM